MWAGSALNVAPCQSPAPPIYVATTNHENARVIGRNGDSVITLLAPPSAKLSELARLVEAHRQGLAEGGHGSDQAEVVVVLLAFVTTSDEQVREDALPALAHFVAQLSKQTVDDAQAEQIYGSMQRAATACFGSPADAQSIIAGLRRTGVRHMAFITRFGNLDSAAARHTLEHLALPSQRLTRSVSRHRDPVYP